MQPSPKPPQPLGEVERAEALARLTLLRSTTPMSSGPQEDTLEALLRAGGRPGWLVSPTGRALGIAVTGEGEPLARAMHDQLVALADERAGRILLTLAHLGGFRDLRFEMVLGEPAWLRAGVRGLSPVQVRVTLEGEGVPEDERARVLGSGSPLGIDVWTDGVRPPTLLVPVEGEPVEDPAAGEKVVVERLVGRPELRFLRREGLADHALVDWQLQQGLGAEAARRVGTVHGTLGTDAPTWVGWQAGALRETVLYGYQ